MKEKPDKPLHEVNFWNIYFKNINKYNFEFLHPKKENVTLRISNTFFK